MSEKTKANTLLIPAEDRKHLEEYLEEFLKEVDRKWSTMRGEGGHCIAADVSQTTRCDDVECSDCFFFKPHWVGKGDDG